MVLLGLTGTTLLLAILGVTLLVGFGADWLAARFRIPDVLWLILLGLFAGPVLGLISTGTLRGIAPLLGTAALVLILFDAGIDLQLSLVRRLAGSAALFAVTSYAVSTAAIFAVSYLVLFPDHPILSLIFGASLGCTSGAVIIPLARRLGFSKGLTGLLHLDAAIEDALAIVIVTTILVLTAPSGPSLVLRLTVSLLLPLPVGVAVGFGAGLAWLLFLYGWQDRPFAALATLGFLFTVYALAEALGGSGILAALVLGAVLGNEPFVRRWLRRSRPFRIAADLRKVELEIAFVLRTFFLFLIGVFVTLSVPRLTETLALVALPLVLLLLRREIFQAVKNPSNLPAPWAGPIAGLYGRGLTSAVLLIVAAQSIPESARLFFPALLLIVGTNVVMTVWLALSPKPPKHDVQDAEVRWTEVRPRFVILGENDDPDGGPSEPVPSPYRTSSTDSRAVSKDGPPANPTGPAPAGTPPLPTRQKGRSP